MIQAVFFDIDGTLVSFKTHRVPQSTVRAIELLQAKGIKTFIATGRSYVHINNLGDLQFDGYITMNGGYCMTGNMQVIHKNPIPRRDIEALIAYQKNVRTFPCLFMTQNDVLINYSDNKVEEIVELINLPNMKPCHNLDELLDHDIFQLVTFFSEDESKDVMKALPDCISARWHPYFSDVIPQENSKQVGIDKMLEHYNIPLQKTMSFGDGGNDIPMLQHTPISVAMGNAHHNVKKCATHVTDSVDDDGIWNMLKKLEII